MWVEKGWRSSICRPLGSLVGSRWVVAGTAADSLGSDLHVAPMMMVLVSILDNHLCIWQNSMSKKFSKLSNLHTKRKFCQKLKDLYFLCNRIDLKLRHANWTDPGHPRVHLGALIHVTTIIWWPSAKKIVMSRAGSSIFDPLSLFFYMKFTFWTH